MGFLVSVLFLFVGVIVSIPFFTLFERKVLGLMQKRKGPKKVTMLGMLQPVFDGVKLMIKESSVLFFSNYFFFYLFCFFSFIFMLFLWFMTPFLKSFLLIQFNMVLLLIVSSLGVYTLVGSGWSSNSKYSLLGSLRGASQLMSYEISMLFMMLVPLLMNFSLDLWKFNFKSKMVFFFLACLSCLWLLVMVAETNRAPFDFAEGESEMVSGFKMEYGALGFAFLFLGEYGSILWMSLFSSLIFFFFKYKIMFFFLVFVVVWFRGSFPRLRYDLLMMLAWKMVLPVGLLYFFSILLFF